MELSLIIATVAGVLREGWEILAESAPYLLFGFFAAGLLKAFIPEAAVARHLGKNSLGTVVKASLCGVPLPLCSCGVIPAAVGLRRQGANKGASAAFLVSVPETGVDSIAITWALLDPFMTIIRPVAAFLTATVTGVLINLLPDAAPTASAANDPCGDPPAQATPATGRSVLERLRAGISWAFTDLLHDIGRWLLLGIGVAAVIAYLLPADFFARFFDREIVSLLIMLAAGIPLYICASASTPVAAALVLKGLSPGAALVFLLAGPATNAATIAVVSRFWGKQATAVYVAAISICSLALGWLTNRLYAWSGADVTRWVADLGETADHPVMVASAVLFLVLLTLACRPRRKPACGCRTDEAPGGT